MSEARLNLHSTIHIYILISKTRKTEKRETYSILEGSGSAKDVVLNRLEEGESILCLGLEVIRRIEVLDMLLEFLQVANMRKIY